MTSVWNRQDPRGWPRLPHRHCGGWPQDSETANASEFKATAITLGIGIASGEENRLGPKWMHRPGSESWAPRTDFEDPLIATG